MKNIPFVIKPTAHASRDIFHRIYHVRNYFNYRGFYRSIGCGFAPPVARPAQAGQEARQPHIIPGRKENQTMRQHTPSPWTAVIQDEIWIQPPNPDDPVVCDLIPRDADSFTLEDEANAYLIAAAPDLLAACEAVIGQLTHHTDVQVPIVLPNEGREGEAYSIKLARAAVAKARGQL